MLANTKIFNFFFFLFSKQKQTRLSLIKLSVHFTQFWQQYWAVTAVTLFHAHFVEAFAMRLPCVLKIFGIITRTQLIASAIQFGVVRMQASNFSERMMDESGKKMLQLSSANNETQNNQSVASCIGENNNVFGAASNEIESQANKPHIVACLNGFKTSFYVASWVKRFCRHFPPFLFNPFDNCRAFYGFIIGTRGAVKTRIEKETDTTFQIPRAGSGNIEIFGKIQENVCMARQQIESIVSSSREKLRVNHFNGVRIYNEDIKSNYERWMVCFVFMFSLSKIALDPLWTGWLVFSARNSARTTYWWIDRINVHAPS